MEVKHKNVTMVVWSYQSGSIDLMPVDYDPEYDSCTPVTDISELKDLIKQLPDNRRDEVEMVVLSRTKGLWV